MKQNKVSYSNGICWIDDCRIPFVDNDKPTGGYGAARIGYGNDYEYDGKCSEANTKGRFPANILVCDDMLNDGTVSKGGRMVNISNPYDFYERTEKTYKIQKSQDINDKGTNSRYYDIDKWFDKLLND